MTEEREPGSGAAGEEAGDEAGDGLDAWMAANFPPKEPEAPPAPQDPTVPVEVDERTQEQIQVQVPETSVIPPMAEELTGIPPAVDFPPAPTEAFAEVHGAGGIDALFGESKFVEYEQGPAASENPFVKKVADPAVSAGSDGGAGDGTAREGRQSIQNVLLWVAGLLVAVLALVALFLVGTKLPTFLGPAPGAAVAGSASPSPSPTPKAVPLGPVAPGEYQWNALLGGECLDPYVGPWEQKYTVVDCATPHAAQLVTRGTFATAEGVIAYPGMEALQSQVNLLCTSPTVVDYAKANAYTDIQYQASFAVSEQEWNNGNHFYYCFLSRSTKGELTGTIAMPQVAPPAPTGAPAP